AELPSPGRVDLIARMTPPFLWLPDTVEREFLAYLMRACITETARQSAFTDDLSRFLQESLAGALFGHCWRARFGMNDDAFSLATRRYLPSWLTTLLEKIDAEPARSLAELQHTLPVSPAQVRRVFQRYLSTSPQAYLTTRRLELARVLLTQTDKSAGDITRMIGFQSQAHFTRCFKNRFGKTPTQHRQDVRSPQI
ncbi:MAG: helix-turn-helix transcriptional regulator, partial [Armatimonadota bacterium]